jgi:hypothetical protein
MLENPMKVLFLDDMEPRRNKALKVFFGQDLKLAVNATSAIAAMKAEKFDLVCLDHDLEEEHYEEWSGDGMWANDGKGSRLKGSGTEVAEFMADELAHSNRPSKVVIHSCNDYGSQRMQSILERVGYSVVRRPFTQWGV